LDIDQANVNQQNRMKEFVNKNANKELYSSKNAKQQAEDNFNRWFKGSKVVDENGQPLNLYHGTDANFDAFDMSKGRSTMDIQGAFFSPYDIDAKGYGQNLKEVYLNIKNPADEATTYKALRKYQGQNDAGLKAKQDLQRQGFDGVFNGYDEYIAFEPNQIKSVNNSGAWSKSASLSDAGWMPKASVDSYTYDFNQFQKDALKQALDKGAYMSTNAKGTLGATHRAQEVLNDMIEASYDTSIIGQKKPTTETRQLMQVKERLNQILEPSGIKPYDAGLSKAKALQDAYEKGYKFKPSETKFEALGLEKARDKRAFLQGRIASILDNVKDDKNIAKAIQADENTLRKLMPEGKYKQLLKDANQIDTEYERVKSLARQAESKLVKKVAKGRPMSEITETQGSVKGTVLGNILSAITRRGDIRRANQYLNPETTQIVTREGLKGAAKKGSAATLRQLLIDRLEGE
jgi:hypothetical protein